MQIRSPLFSGVSLAVAGLASTATASLSQTHSTSLDAKPLTTTTTSASNNGAGFSGSNSVISFNAENFYDNSAYNPQDSLFIGSSNNDNNGVDASKTFVFTVASTEYNVTEVQLNVNSNGSTIGQYSSTLTTGPQEQFPVEITVTVATAAGGITQTGTIVITNTNSIITSGYSEVALYFEVLWTKGDSGTGMSYSRSFGFVNPASGTPSKDVYAQFTNPGPVHPEISPGATTTTTRASATATTGSTTPTSTNNGASLSGPASSSSSSGLSKGAIAGIVVGAVAAIAILAALAFFFIRRRNSNEKRNAYNAALMSGSVEPYRGAGPVSDLGGTHANLHDGVGSGTAVNLMEKDAFAGGVSAAAGHEIGGPNSPSSPNNPHSPYSDEDGTGTPQIIPSRNIATSAADTPVVSPVAAQGQPVPTTSTAAAPPPATAPAAPAVRGQVAALIEDHMTPEDVARLEAEERELDADIENAIRNRAASRQA